MKELYFPTPIYFFDFENQAELNTFLKVRIYSWRDLDLAGIVRSNVKQLDSWHSATTMNHKPEYKLFIEQIHKHVQFVFQDQQYEESTQPYCHNMWANVNPRYAYNRSHTHPGSLWSGVYYVQAPQGCGRLVFQDPRAQAQVALPNVNKTGRGAEHWPEVYYEAKPGRLILFPSWLRHEVEPNMSSLTGQAGDRISISFNYGQTTG